MASKNNDDQAKDSPHSSSTCGPSKAQFHLQKTLLNTRSATTPRQVNVNGTNNAKSSKIASPSSTSLSVADVPKSDVPMFCNLDLNLAPPPETHEDSPSPPLHGCEKVPERNLPSPEENNGDILQGKSSENDMEGNGALGNNSTKLFGAFLDVVEGKMEKYGSNDLKGNKLTEPSKAEERNESSGRTRRRLKRNTGEEEEAAAASAASIEEELTPPVVKSNRGRTQMLPYKYRDSVIEPLKNLWSRSSRSSSNNVPTKRRPR